jgi:hypothetical protein
MKEITLNEILLWCLQAQNAVAKFVSKCSKDLQTQWATTIQCFLKYLRQTGIFGFLQVGRCYIRTCYTTKPLFQKIASQEKVWKLIRFGSSANDSVDDLSERLRFLNFQRFLYQIWILSHLFGPTLGHICDYFLHCIFVWNLRRVCLPQVARLFILLLNYSSTNFPGYVWVSLSFLTD